WNAVVSAPPKAVQTFTAVLVGVCFIAIALPGMLAVISYVKVVYYGLAPEPWQDSLFDVVLPKLVRLPSDFGTLVVAAFPMAVISSAYARADIGSLSMAGWAYLILACIGVVANVAGYILLTP